MPLDSKHPKASFSPTSTDVLYFRVAEVPKSQDLVIFLWSTMFCFEIGLSEGLVQKTS